MIRITDPKNCCGCTACVSGCPHNAIIMTPDKMGFLYPNVDASKCTNCGLCEQICAFNDHYNISLNFSFPIPYAVRHKDINQIETSRSGAAFIALSDWVLEQNGVVYGAAYSDHFKVVHKRATTKKERDEFKGSKYVQSDLSNIFKQIKSDLKNDIIVLFSGTPCQTSGLASYIGNSLRKNLYLIDIVCHGVPSPYVWEEYLKFLEKKHNTKIQHVNFRDKKYGWSSHIETYNNKFSETIFTDLFYSHIMFRQSCGNCHFCNLNRPSDITIADFWGWEKTNSDFNIDNKGCSLVLINTENGNFLFDNIKNSINYIPAKIENCLQHNLQSPSDINSLKRIKFEQDFNKWGFKFVCSKYTKNGIIYRLIEKKDILFHKLSKLFNHK